MEQGGLDSGRSEIIAQLHQFKIRVKQCSGAQKSSESLKIRGNEQQECSSRGNQKHGAKRGKKALDASGVKLLKRKGAILGSRPYNAGNQIARDNKENIHAHKAAGKTGNACMVKHNRQHRDCSQTIDFWTVIRVRIILTEEHPTPQD